MRPWYRRRRARRPSWLRQARCAVLTGETAQKDRYAERHTARKAPRSRATFPHARRNPRRILRLIELTTVLVACACSAASEPAAAGPIDSLASPLADASYIDAGSYFTEPADIDAWYSLTSTLKAEFDAVCGDTFCEGDYSNYESLGFRCSIEQRSGALGQCVWIFAASQDEIDPTTGEVTVAGELWSCAMPLEPFTAAHGFLHALSSSDEGPLYARLPGSERALYDGLIDCL